jgi:hypothetical protein
MRKLSDREQAILMFLAFTLPALMIWTGFGFPTDRVALGALATSVLGGALALIKEWLGGGQPQQNSYLDKEGT